MKKDKIMYWAATGFVALAMTASAFMYLTKNPELVKGMQSAGFPLFMLYILGTAKLLGAIALVVPLWDKVKEWAYAGFAFVFIGAVWTHIATSTPFIAPLVFLVVLGLSYWFRSRLKAKTVSIR